MSQVTMRLQGMQIGESVSQTFQQFKESGKIILKDKVLLTPGEWNGLQFSAEEIKKGYEMTDWNNKDNYALIYDHDEKAINWLGNVINIRMSDSGELIGDLEIFDENLARKLTIGQAKLGISARVVGYENEEGELVNFTFENFSVVYDPACKNAYINLSEDKLGIKLKELEERVEKLEGVTSASDVSGKNIGDKVKTNQKVKYSKKKKKDEDMEEKYTGKINPGDQFITKDGEEVIVSEVTPKQGKITIATERGDKQMDIEAFRSIIRERKEEMKDSNSNQLKGGELSDSTMEKQEEKLEQVEEKKEEAVKQSEEKQEVETEKPEVSEELSSKLDLVLKQMKEMSERITKLEEEDAEDESEDTEESKEAELSQKEEKKPLAEIELSQDRNLLKGMTPNAVGFAKGLLGKAAIK